MFLFLWGNFILLSIILEKPSEEKAQALLNINALWNCGVFAFKLKFLIDFLMQKGMSLYFEQQKTEYNTLSKISFDYEVVGKAKHVVALPYDNYWKGLGTWNTLTEEMANAQIGKGVMSDDNVNTHLINELDIPVTVIGVKDIVVASPGGILVADKASSPKIKGLISGFDQPPMYQRMWGWSRVLDYAKYDEGNEMVTKRICIHAGKNSSYHYHNLRDEVWTIVRGEGEMALDDYITRVKAGDIIHLPAGKKHRIKAISELEFVEVQTGIGISDQDFIRLYFEWDDVLHHFDKSKAKAYYKEHN